MFIKPENNNLIISSSSCTDKLYVEIDFSSEEARLRNEMEAVNINQDCNVDEGDGCLLGEFDDHEVRGEGNEHEVEDEGNGHEVRSEGSEHDVGDEAMLYHLGEDCVRPGFEYFTATIMGKLRPQLDLFKAARYLVPCRAVELGLNATLLDE